MAVGSRRHAGRLRTPAFPLRAGKWPSHETSRPFLQRVLKEWGVLEEREIAFSQGKIWILEAYVF